MDREPGGAAGSSSMAAAWRPLVGHHGRMRHNPAHAETDEREVRRLIDENPWITIVSQTDEGLVASHYPAMLSEDDDSLTIITHVGRPDERAHDFGDREVLVIAS